MSTTVKFIIAAAAHDIGSILLGTELNGFYRRN